MLVCLKNAHLRGGRFFQHHLFHNSFSGTLNLMVGRGRLLLLMGLAAIIVGLVTITGSTVGAADVFPVMSVGVWQAQNDFKLEVWISPEAGQPGDQLFLNLNLSTQTRPLTAPELEIFLPGSLALEMANLPVATSYNIQTNRLIWRPILNATDNGIRLTVPLTISSVDLSKPEQTVQVVLRDGATEVNYSAGFWTGLPPQATIKFSLPQVAVGQAVRLIGEMSGPGPYTQNWDLGDGRTITVDNPEVIFSIPGDYQISLRASNPIGTVVSTGLLTVSAQPMARFNVADSTIAVGDSMTLVDQSGGQQPLHYSWDYGDGVRSNEARPNHQYLAPGAYQVHLTISNELGQSDAYQTITIGERPTADIVVDSTPAAGQLFELQAFHDNSVSNVRWNMGDGNYYDGEHINHVYWATGDYLISTTFVNDFGETVIQQWIQVRPGTLFLYLPFISHGGNSELAQSFPSPAGIEQAATAEFEAPALNEAGQLLSLELPEDLQPAEQLYAYINKARQINNLAPLQMVYELNSAAQTHSDDMASLGFTGHEGSDGSSPALRIQRSTYAGGYAGEATAWGMQSAIEPVQFWLTSPTHREIILNPSATEVGVGFSLNFGAPSVWYWTAEFASMNLPPVHVPIPRPAETAGQQGEGELSDPNTPPAIQLLGPPQDSDFLLSNDNYLIFTWSWPEPLLPDHRFAVYLNARGRIYQIGAVREVQSGTQYQFKVLVSDVPVAPGAHQWVVRLEDSAQGEMLAESPYWPLSIRQP